MIHQYLYLIITNNWLCVRERPLFLLSYCWWLSAFRCPDRVEEHIEMGQEMDNGFISSVACSVATGQSPFCMSDWIPSLRGPGSLVKVRLEGKIIHQPGPQSYTSQCMMRLPSLFPRQRCKHRNERCSRLALGRARWLTISRRSFSQDGPRVRAVARGRDHEIWKYCMEALLCKSP